MIDVLLYIVGCSGLAVLSLALIIACILVLCSIIDVVKQAKKEFKK